MKPIKRDMKDLFFIVKGKYAPKTMPSFTNKVTGEEQFIGGYDPENENTEEWYMLLDRKTYFCIACGGSLENVLKAVYRTIVHFKTARNYFKHVCKVTSEDYYEVNYLHKPPLTQEQRTKKAEGRCPRVSPAMKEIYAQIDLAYGWFFEDMIDERVGNAYDAISNHGRIFDKDRSSSQVGFLNIPDSGSGRIFGNVSELARPSDEKAAGEVQRRRGEAGVGEVAKVKVPMSKVRLRRSLRGRLNE